ncbi:SPX-domain-containing protein [Saitoella complicata NRRL Y-17804]|uniref:SPX-domain-containing protein n=1 Tax=Saitoella complicata (strain BCRC 22490 / CBS 7301 / JCM 7358 / NBRC 10748 / NRRL Y-17804) TaxID=698492 RepID=UPI000866CC07|nr:SPX-domain-containing protein [Saitoella complicata NRRL Y-17804]ODQ56367.1 SPX-domain-containing protein [Saitoella complicata NRRL Y-17804]
MKFSHSLQFNAVPDWADYYINYSNLKKLIYQIEKDTVLPSNTRPATADEESTLIDSSSRADNDFRRACDKELTKIIKFYEAKERELYEEFQHLLTDVGMFEDEMEDMLASITSESNDRRTGSSRPRRMSSSYNAGKRKSFSARARSNSNMNDDDDSGEDSDGGAPRSPLLPTTRRRMSQSGTEDELRASQMWDDETYADSALNDTRITLKKRIIQSYVSLSELRSYIQLNSTGFSKGLKKYDKTCGRNLRTPYLEQTLANAYPFKTETRKELDNKIGEIESAYARLLTEGNIAVARKDLKTHLREHVVWERNTVWRDMISIERRAEAATVARGQRGLLGGGAATPPEQKEMNIPQTFWGRLRRRLNGQLLTLLVIISIFVALIYAPTFEAVEQRNCMAMLVFVSLLWATEVIPLFVTSLLVPFLVVLLRICRTDDEHHKRMAAPDVTKYIFGAMWTPVIMLLLGGFVIAGAMSKYNIAKLMATTVLSRVGTKPRNVLLANMFVAMIASMWISNVAAPVLCYSIIAPVLRTLPAESNFAKCLILGIALASNVGGMASPIASPQNIVALQNMQPTPSWAEWFFVSLPVSVVSILLIWGWLLFMYAPGKETTIAPIRSSKDKFTGTQYFISLVTFLTIGLWCIERNYEGIFGDMGVIAIIPIVLFFGTGILTKEDFNNLLWTVVILAMGGIALGKSVNSSGLLQTIAHAIRDVVEGMSMWMVMFTFACLVLVMATFVSHTVAALIILPIVAEVGTAMENPHPRLLVMTAALLCSAAMGLPTSGFPNMVAISQENELGVRYLSVKDFIKTGIPASFLAFGVVISLGYFLSSIVGF